MTTLGFYPGMQWTDRDGRLTAEAQRLLQQIVLSQNGEGAGATIDGIQTLTNKTISGDSNTLENIGTNSLKTRTGEDNWVVTGTAGTSGQVARWDENGDLVGTSTVYLTETLSDELYMRRDGIGTAFAPIRLETYTVAGAPAAADYTQGLIYVSNETGGATVAFSDGTNWRRVQDRAIIS